jgi:hypothetical protein
MPDVSTEVAIATTTLGTAASTVEFSSIPTTYTDLRLVLLPLATSGGVIPGIRLNPAVSSTYSGTRLIGDGSTASSTRETGQNYLEIRSEPVNTTTPILIEIDIFSYTASINKTVLIKNSADLNGSGTVTAIVGLIQNTAAINVVRFILPGDTFKAGTTATLYGIL